MPHPDYSNFGVRKVVSNSESIQLKCPIGAIFIRAVFVDGIDERVFGQFASGIQDSLSHI